MSQLIPAIGVKGRFVLAAPFAAKLLPNTSYTCVAVRRLEDVVAAGEDPQALYYTPNGLDAARYNADLADNVCIVSLQAAIGEWLYVPSSSITAMPDQGGVPYTVTALAVNLGAIPNSLNLLYLKNQISEVVAATLGVVAPPIHAVALSPTTNVSQTEHDTLEAAREANRVETVTDRANLLAVTAQRDAALTRIAQLENQLKTLLQA
jgi:hypothetical protein